MNKTLNGNQIKVIAIIVQYDECHVAFGMGSGFNAHLYDGSYT